MHDVSCLLCNCLLNSFRLYLPRPREDSQTAEGGINLYLLMWFLRLTAVDAAVNKIKRAMDSKSCSIQDSNFLKLNPMVNCYVNSQACDQDIN